MRQLNNKKRLRAVIMSIILLMTALLGKGVGVNAATHILAKKSSDIEIVDLTKLSSAEYAFSLRADKETRIEYWGYNGKIIQHYKDTSNSSYIMPQDDNLSEKIGCWIYNCGMYKGQIIDVKCTFKWEPVTVYDTYENLNTYVHEPPLIGYYIDMRNHRICNYISNHSYEVQYELYSNGKPITVNMSLTFGDIDGNEWYGFSVDKGSINKIQCRNDCGLYYREVQNKKWFYAESTSSNDGPEASLRFEIDNVSRYSIVYGVHYDIDATYRYFERIPAYDTVGLIHWGVEATKEWLEFFDSNSSSVPNAGWAYFTATAYTKYDIPAPTKGIQVQGDYDSELGRYLYQYKESVNLRPQEQFTYGIFQQIPLESKEYYYDTFEISDTLPSRSECSANYISAQILNESGADVTDNFIITVDNRTITAKAKESFVKSDDFYNNTYTMLITCKFSVDKNVTFNRLQLDNVSKVKVTRENETTTKNSNKATVQCDLKDLTIKKVWNDQDNQDGKRPDSIMADLYLDVFEDGKLLDSTKIETVTLSKASDWKSTVKVWDEATDYGTTYDGTTTHTYRYRWAEATSKDYKATQKTEGNTTTITNTYTPDTTSATIIKLWDDANDQDGIRPDSIECTLFADGVEKQTVTLSENNGWQKTINELPKNKNGKEINYTWKERIVANYTSKLEVNGTVTTVTNTHIPEKVSVSVKKIWRDENDAEGMRPDSITVTLKANGKTIGSYNITKKDDWQLTIDNLDKYESGKPMNYTWEESSVNGYTSTVKTDGYNSIIINTHMPKYDIKTEIDHGVMTKQSDKKEYNCDDAATKLPPQKTTGAKEMSKKLIMNPSQISPKTGRNIGMFVFMIFAILQLFILLSIKIYRK